MKKIVITGGTYSGKTSIINVLRNKGYFIVEESAMEIISELNNKLGVEGQIKWRLENYAAFQVMIAKKQYEKEQQLINVNENVVFLDSGIHEGISYCITNEVIPPPVLNELAKKQNYDLVFLCETLSNFDERKETGRMFNRESSIKTKNLINKTYEEYDMKAILLPEMSLKKRIDFICSYLND